MALATQCPHCQTTFRVANDQLKLRGGLVRCGSCREVFNGIEHLVRPDMASPAVTAVPTSDTIGAAAQTDFTTSTVAVAATTDHTLRTAADTKTVELPQTTPETSTSDRVEAAIDDLEEDLRIAEETSQSSPADVHHTPFGLIKPSSSPESSEGPGNQPSPNVWHRQVDDDNRMARMTLMHVAGQYDYTLDAAGKAKSKDDPAPSDDEDLDRIIDELQRKPWRGEKNSSLAASSDGTDIEKNGSKKKNRGKAAEPVQEVADEPDFVLRARRKQRIGGILHVAMWGIAALLLIGAVGQSTYFFRDQLAVRLPQIKPLLTSACAKIGCSVGLPMKIDSISIDANELQALDPARNVFSLNLLMRNRSDTVQAWPNIELTLNDANDKAIMRRVFTPREYLNTSTNLSQGFGSDQEQSVKLTFELLQLKTSGYRVYLFYP